MAVDRAPRPGRAADALGASPSFRGLREPWLRVLGQAAALRSFRAGEELPAEACLYLVTAGDVVSEEAGREGPGTVFGDEEGVVYRAAGPVEAYVWKLPDLERLFGENDGLRRELETRLSLRRRRSELVDLLRRTTLFGRVGQSLLRSLAGSATLARFDAGSAVCRQGDEGDELFLIVSGEVAFYRDDAPEPVRQLRRGDVFGEIGLVGRSVRTASAITVSDAEVLTISRDAFDALYRRSSPFREAVRLTAEMRLASDRSSPPAPELVWLVNDSPLPSEELAERVVGALTQVVGQVAGPFRLEQAPEAQRASYVVYFSDGLPEERVAREVVDRAGCVLHVTGDDAAPFPYRSTPLDRVHQVDALALQGAGLGRIARTVAGRRVGVALGGGAAWGYAHVALLRGLERAQIPVDMLVGASVGSLVGVFYASQGLRGLDRLVNAKLEVSAAALAAIATTSSVDLFLRRHIPERRLEELPLPFAAVAVDAQTGREKVFRRGSLAAAVRASCSLPGVFGRPIRGGRRYLDACVRNNVPASHCADAGADFVIACDVVPEPRASRDMRSGLRGLALEVFQINRLTDMVRSLYWLAGERGAAQDSLADALFSPDLAEFFPWDFHRADEIVDKAEEQLDEWLAATGARYRALSRADG